MVSNYIWVILSVLSSIYPPPTPPPFFFFGKHQHAPNLKRFGPGEPAPNAPTAAWERNQLTVTMFEALGPTVPEILPISLFWAIKRQSPFSIVCFA